MATEIIEYLAWNSNRPKLSRGNIEAYEKRIYADHSDKELDAMAVSSMRKLGWIESSVWRQAEFKSQAAAIADLLKTCTEIMGPKQT